MRPGTGGELADDSEAQIHTKTYSVEPDGMKRESMSLPGESRSVRAVRQSAEAVVVTRLAERSEERRAEAWDPQSGSLA